MDALALVPAPWRVALRESSTAAAG
jgi:hypothetical protein